MGQTGPCEEKGGDYPGGWDHPTPHSHGPSTSSSETQWTRGCIERSAFVCWQVWLYFHFLVFTPYLFLSSQPCKNQISKYSWWQSQGSRLVCCPLLLDFRGIKQQLSAIKVLKSVGIFCNKSLKNLGTCQTADLYGNSHGMLIQLGWGGAGLWAPQGLLEWLCFFSSQNSEHFLQKLPPGQARCSLALSQWGISLKVCRLAVDKCWLMTVVCSGRQLDARNAWELLLASRDWKSLVHIK